MKYLHHPRPDERKRFIEDYPSHNRARMALRVKQRSKRGYSSTFDELCVVVDDLKNLNVREHAAAAAATTAAAAATGNTNRTRIFE